MTQRRSHTNRLARSLSAAAGCTYQQALNQVLSASEQGLLPDVLNDEGMASALSILLDNFIPGEVVPPDITSSSSPSLSDLVGLGALSEQMRDFLVAAVFGNVNILITGSTGSGKTTLLGALAAYIPASERVLTIEEFFPELNLGRHNTLQLLTKRPHPTMEELLSSASFMKAHSILVGDFRGAESALSVAKLSLTSGSKVMATMHASSVSSAMSNNLPRLLTKARPGLSLEDANVVSTSMFDVVIHVARYQGALRYISEISLANAAGPDSSSIGSTDLTTVFVGVLSGDGVVSFERVSPVVPESHITGTMGWAIVKALQTLSEQERSVISYRYGFYDSEPWPHHKIAEHLNVSVESIRQVEKVARIRLNASDAGRILSALFGPDSQ